MATFAVFLLAPALAPALAQHWVPIKHERVKPTVDTDVLGNLKETKVLQKKELDLSITRTHALVAQLDVGTPAQKMSCLLDTGSADLWIPSKRCKTCENEHLFHAERSASFSPELMKSMEGTHPVAVRLTYGTGEIVGFKVQDTVQFGGAKIKNQSFIIVEDAQLPPQRGWDGICGLAWENIAQLKPLYRRLQDMGHKAMFSFVPEGSSSAHLVLGQVPHYAVKPGTLVWADAEVMHQGQGRSFWITKGGIAVHKKKPHAARFLVDTGTNQVLLAPRRLYVSIMRSVLPQDKFNDLCGMDEMAGGAVFCDCSIVEQSKHLPPLRIFLADRPFELPIGEMFSRIPTKDGRGEACLLAVQPNNLDTTSLGGSMPMPLPFGGLGGLLPDMPFDLPFPIDLPNLLGPFGLEQGKLRGTHGSAHDQRPSTIFGPGFGGNGKHNKQDLGKALGAAFGGAFGGGKFGTFGGAFGNLSIGHLGKGVQQEQIAEEIRTRPDGTVCKYITVTENGHVKSRKEECAEPGGDVRRLQLVVPMGGILEIPLDPAGMEAPTEGPDLWILGGMFLERFVVSFDFDKGRMGVAEPATGTEGLDTIGMANLREVQEPGQVSFGAVAAGALLCSLALAVAYATLRVKRLARDDTLLHRAAAE